MTTATLALIISVFSAAFTAGTMFAQRRANSIALLPSRLEITESYNALKHHMISKGQFASMSEVNAFYWQLLKARACFSEDLANLLNRYHEICFKIAQAHEYKLPTNEEPSLQSQEQQLRQQIDGLILSIPPL